MNTFDALDLNLLPDLDQAEVLKMTHTSNVTFKAYCTKCRTNWAALKETEIDDNIETHHVCPKCMTNLHLVEAIEGKALTPYKPFEPVANILQNVQLPSMKRYKPPLNKEQRTALFEAREAKQDERLDEYIANCEKYGKEEATRIYNSKPLLVHYDTEIGAVIVQ